MQRIWLIRHGLTLANQRRLYCGKSDLPLLPEGEAALAALRAVGGYPDPAGKRVITSGMRRTNQTARLLLHAEGWEEQPAFREIDFGEFELHSYEELKDRADYQTWLTGDNEKNRCPHGESGREMKRRVLAAWEAAVRDGRDAVIITHGGPIAALVEELFPAEGGNRYQRQPAPGRGWRILLEDGAPMALTPVPEERDGETYEKLHL